MGDEHKEGLRDFRMEYMLLQASDIISHENEMLYLMNIILKDNISQLYPNDLAKQYVSKIPGYIEDGSAFVVGAFEDGILVGFSWAYELSIFGERRCHIDMIGVNPEYRKRGIAKKILELQINEIKKRGISIVEAMTTRNNENSYNWFHSMGFDDERVKVRKDLEC